tara:strand:- start:355971 stop:356456 length:486 start_codon:yes stop_codon:yes gene_type:complete
MGSDKSQQIDAFSTPGLMLKVAREARGLTEREAADRLNLMPDYVGILERDDYDALRSPPFARGYVKAYAKLLDLDVDQILTQFDELRQLDSGQQVKRIETRPLQLQRTGAGVVFGLVALFVLVLVLWWWRGDASGANAAANGAVSSDIAGDAVESLNGGGQ